MRQLRIDEEYKMMRPGTIGFAVTALLILLMEVSLCYGLGSGEAGDSQYNDVKYIRLQVPDWDIELSRSYLSNGVELHYADYDSNLYNFDLQKNGSDLIINITQKPGLHFFTARNPRLEISLPEFIDMDISSESGDIRLADRVSGKLKIRTSSGNVSGSDIQGNIEIRSISGDISFNSVQGDISVETSSGGIDIDNAQGELKLKSSSGHVVLRSSVATVDVQSVSGDIRFSQFEAFESASFSSNSGDINIELLGDLDQFNFLVRSSSGEIRLFNQRADKSLRAGNGAIPVSIATSSGDIRVY